MAVMKVAAVRCQATCRSSFGLASRGACLGRSKCCIVMPETAVRYWRAVVSGPQAASAERAIFSSVARSAPSRAWIDMPCCTVT